MIKPAVIVHLLASLAAHLRVLREAQQIPRADLLANPLDFAGVLYELQVAIQHVIDISAHILAGAGQALPENYQETIQALGRAGILPDEFARRIAPMAGFRNIIVHGYLVVDPDIVCERLQFGLDDFVNDYLRREGYLDGDES